MKVLAVFVLLALSGACSARPESRVLDVIGDAVSQAGQSILDHAQQVGQNLIDTYVPILGQAAQQLVGEAIQNAGSFLTDLLTGKRQVDLQTEIGQILHDGIMQMLEHATNAINNVQTSLSSAMNSIFGASETRKLTFRKMKTVDMQTRKALKTDGKVMAKKMGLALMKKLKAVKNARIIDQAIDALGTLVQPVVDAANTAFQNLVDGATALGQAVAGHATDLVNNVGTTFNQVTDQLTQVVQPYIDDAQTIVDSVTNHFQENYGMGVTA